MIGTNVRDKIRSRELADSGRIPNYVLALVEYHKLRATFNTSDQLRLDWILDFLHARHGLRLYAQPRQRKAR